MVNVTVFKNLFLKGYDGGDLQSSELELSDTVSIFDALPAHYPTDARFAPYFLVKRDDGGNAQVLPKIPRINSTGLDDLKSQGIALMFSAYVLDVDGPEHSADDGWQNEHQQLRENLPAELSDSMGWYETRNGYRLLWLCQRPMGPDKYLGNLRRLHGKLKNHGIEADESCIEISRLYRLPYVCREGTDERHPADFSWLGKLKVAKDWQASGGLWDAMGQTRTRFEVPDQIEPGQRNSTLTRVAGRHRRGGLEYEEIVAALEATNQARCDPPLDMSDIEQIARSVCRYDAGTPENNDGGNGGGNGGAMFQLGSHVEIAQRAVDDLMDKKAEAALVFDRTQLWKYNHVLGLWRTLEQHVVQRHVSTYDGEFVVSGNDRQGNPRLRPLKVSTGMTEAVYDMVCIQKANSGFFNDQKEGLTFRNGFVTVDENGVNVDPFSSEQRATVGLPFDYVPNAVPVRFVQMLKDCFRDDSDQYEKILCLRQFIGICLQGKATQYQKGCVLTGDGSNGKSSFQEIVQHLFKGAKGMVTAVPPQDMDNEYRRAMLANSRLNVVNELPEADILNSEACKAIISGDLIVARHIREAPFEYRPRCGQLYSANSLPGVRDMSRGFWRRWIIVEWNRVFSDTEANRNIVFDCLKELPAIASWALDSTVEVIRNGHYVTPESSQRALEDWRRHSDQVAAFVDDKTYECERGTASSDLYGAYCQWAAKNGHRALSSTNFGKRLLKLGVIKKKKSDANYYLVGLRKVVALSGTGRA
jgi:putative DNA primase/helicase